jgi:hypothetical protein
MPIVTTTTSSELSTVPLSAASDNTYILPLEIGTTGQVIAVPSSGDELIWANSGGSGDIYNGGQTGAVTIGSTDNVTTIIGTGIKLEGGFDVKYNNISSGVASYSLDESLHFVDFTNIGTETVQLPEIDQNSGQQFIISKGFSGGLLTIYPNAVDTIDGDASFELSVINQRISIISNDRNQWMIF